MRPASIRSIALSLRTGRRATHGLRAARSDLFWANGRLLRRLVLVVPSGGCSTPTCSMCPLPNLAGSTPTATVIALIHDSILAAGQVQMLSLYNDGSYFAPKEMSVEFRERIEDLVCAAGIEVFNVESLPCFIERERVEATMKRSGARLLINVGIQSADSRVRERCIGSPFTQAHVDSAFEVAAATGAMLRVYLLFKPPFLNEYEAMQDLAASLERFDHPRVFRLSINPCKVASGTVLEKIHEAGLYRPPHLFSVAKVLSAWPANEIVSVEQPGYGSCPGDIAQPHLCDACSHVWQGSILIRDSLRGEPECWLRYLQREPTEGWENRERLFLTQNQSPRRDDD